MKKGGFCTRGKESRGLHTGQKPWKDWGGNERGGVKGERERKRRSERRKGTKEEE